MKHKFIDTISNLSPSPEKYSSWLVYILLGKPTLSVFTLLWICSEIFDEMAEDHPSRYVKLTKDQAPLEDIKPGELNQPIDVPQVSTCLSMISKFFIFFCSISRWQTRNACMMIDWDWPSTDAFPLWKRGFFLVIRMRFSHGLVSRFPRLVKVSWVS